METVRVVLANTIGITFGRMWRLIWCHRPAPEHPGPLEVRRAP